MSCSKWRWTEKCDTHPCPGDCDLCDENTEDEGMDEIDYTTTSDPNNIQAQAMMWEEFDDDL